MKLQVGVAGSVGSSSAARRLHWRSTEQRWFKTRNWLREMVPSARAMGVWRGRVDFCGGIGAAVGGGEFAIEIGGAEGGGRGVSMRVAEAVAFGMSGEAQRRPSANRSWQRFSEGSVRFVVMRRGTVICI